MWEKSNQRIFAGDGSTNIMAARDVNLLIASNVPTELVDQKTKEEVDALRKSRFFPEFDRIGASLRLGKRLSEGKLSGGSEEVRGVALAWCARILSRSDELERAEEFLKLAKSLGESAGAKIAESFIHSQKGDKLAALRALAGLDSDTSRSARLMIIIHHDSAERGLKWMTDSGYTADNLDSDGKSVLLSHQLQLGCWGDVAKTVAALSEADFETTPVLHHLAGLATLLPAVHRDFRALVLTQVPFDAHIFPLDSHAAAMKARRVAYEHFLAAVDVAKKLDCLSTAKIDDEYALWLELRSPDQAAHGKNRLEQMLRDSKCALGVVHYAIGFGIQLDLHVVERDIEREVTVHGGYTLDAALARFALAFTKSSPEEAANYIARHHKQLAEHLDERMLQRRQVEMLSRAGLTEKATEVLNRLLEQGISSEEEKTLRRIIVDAEGRDPVRSCKEQYKATGALADLLNLVNELEDHQHWADVCEFGAKLFDETGSLQDAERLVAAFNNTNSSGPLIEFLSANPDLLQQSRSLQMSYAWGLYNEGALLDARAALEKLSDNAGATNYRALHVNLCIATGNWASLLAYIESEFKNRSERSAHDLIGAAQLALHLGAPQAKDLVFEAEAKANGDAAILSAAYFIASSAGWEDDPKVSGWLEKAAELSGEGGPVERVSLKDIIERKPAWERRESEIWQLLAQGQVPIFLAAQSLNRTLVDLTTFPALANVPQADPRRRSAIPAYSGKREPVKLDIIGKVVALDPTALLSLSFLKILDEALDAFETVFIPHSTLGWLFEERQKAAFHQPSRIAHAREVRDLLAIEKLEKFNPSTVASSELSSQVGDDLAALIAEAEKVRERDDTQHIVVRSAPVHRLSSLMEEEADLSAHETVLSSCLAVVEKLRQKGGITAEEEKRARAYFQLRENLWPNQPKISDGAVLYLDSFAISSLLHLGLLGKLKSAGLTAIASPKEISEVDALISYERISEEVKEGIERIRSSLQSGIESGRIKLSARNNFDALEEKSTLEHPTLGIIALAPHCDAVIVDDRFINQHQHIDKDGTLAPTMTTLDMLEALEAAGVISSDDRLEYRTRLRRAGYFFIPLDEDELERCLKESIVSGQRVVETAELKAMRESVLRVRMSDWLQLPEEALWLDRTLKAFVRVLQNLWVDGANIDDVRARSNWLVAQVDVRGWAHSFLPGNADDIVRIGRAVHILVLLTPPVDVQQTTAEAYWSWVEERVLAPIQEQFPEVYQWLVEWHRRHLVEMVDAESSERAGS